MNAFNPKLSTASAIAPATCANVAVGYDILGFAIDALHDRVDVVRRSDDQLQVKITSDDDLIPNAPDKNTASVAIMHLLKDQKIKAGFDIHITKGIPLASGLGGSAASAVAAVVAVNALLSQPLSLEQLAEYALSGEEISSGGRHADNVAPCLLGGLTLIQSLDPLKVLSLPCPDIYCAVVHPHMMIETRKARELIQPEQPLTTFVEQSAHLAGFISALYQNDLALLQASFHDVLIEPIRATLIPGFEQVKQAANQAGALGVAISGSGPSLLALAKSKKEAEQIAKSMSACFVDQKIQCDHWVSRFATRGAQAIKRG